MKKFMIEVEGDVHTVGGDLSGAVSEVFARMDLRPSLEGEASYSRQDIFVFDEDDYPSGMPRSFTWTRLPKVETLASQKEAFYASHSGSYSTPLLEAAAQQFVEDPPQRIVRCESRRAYVMALLEREMSLHLGAGEVKVPLSVLTSLLAALALLGQGGGGDLGGSCGSSQLPLLPRLSIFRHRSRASEPYMGILRENADRSCFLSLWVEPEQDNVLLSVSWTDKEGDHKVPFLEIGRGMSPWFSRELVLALWRALHPKNDEDVKGVTLPMNVQGDPVCILAARGWLKSYLKI